MAGEHHKECDQGEVAVGWALHALEPEEESGFARHLPRCADCTDRVAATAAMAAVLAAGVDQLEPPPRLREAIIVAARTSPSPRLVPLNPESAPAPARSVVSAQLLGRTRRALVAAVAAGVLAFGAGWAGNALLQPSSGASQSALPQLSDPSVHRTAIMATGTDRVMAIVLTDSSGASVVPVDMPAAPAGTAYWLWGTGSGAPTPLGKVSVGPGAGAAVQSPVPTQPAKYPGYAVSVEPESVVPVAPSTVLATSGTI